MLKVRRSFSVGRRTYRQGRIVDPDDPVVKGREHLFVDLDEEAAAARPVEQATAAPGERREVFLAAKQKVAKAKKKAAKKAAKADTSDDSESEPTKGVTLVCDDCGREFKNQGGLSSHQRAKHA